MGLFDWFMHGLGFETDEKRKQKKGKNLEALDKYANFDLHEKVDSQDEQQKSGASNASFATFGLPNELNVVILEPKTHKEMQHVVDCLKRGEIVAVNLENITLADAMRILDFLSGAIYGLNGSIYRWKDDMFMLAPEGGRIYKKE